MKLIRTNIRAEDGRLIREQSLGFFLDKINGTEYFNVLTIEMPNIRLALKETEFVVLASSDETETLFSIYERMK